MSGTISHRRRLTATLRARARKLLPERQLFIRSEGAVRVVHLTRRRQATLGVIALLAMVLVAAGAKALLLQWQALDRHAETMAQLVAEHDSMADELDELRLSVAHWNRHYDDITSELERKYGLLVSLTESREQAEGRHRALRSELKLLEHDREAASAGDPAIEARYQQLREELSQATYLRPEPDGSLVYKPLQMSLAYGGALDGDGPPADRPEIPSMAISVESADQLLARAIGERNLAQQRKHRLETHLARLERRLATVRGMQDMLIDRLSAGTDRNIDQLEQALALTGLDLDNLLERVGEDDDAVSGAGGPFVSLPSPERLADTDRTPLTHPETGNSAEDQFEAVLDRMGFRLARLSALNVLAERLPLDAPVEDYKLQSPFGKRRDPITGRWAQHNGLDLSADRRAPVLAPAPGVVTFAGWNGPYGRMVEIDHGYGLKTRYGHLYRIHVKSGQRVVKRQQIGVMGSSGRSTGRHLHYEVHFDDRPLDPMTFLEAGDHVFKNRQN
jgi:murein DD-endopeptidase MepM/ murein hydrolase activator NlpD